MPSTSRRRLLSVAGGTAAALLGGCTGRRAGPGSTPGSDAAATTAAETPRGTSDRSATTAETDAEPTTEPTPDRATPEPTTGEGRPVTVERTVTDDGLTYLNETDEVRYVAAYRHTNRDEVENGSEPEREPVYETVPFERWARTECASVAAAAVGETLEERLGQSLDAVSTGISSGDEGPVVTVAHTVTRDREGDVESRPSVAFDRLVSVTPASADATIVFEGHRHSETIPVRVRHVAIRYE
jgi:hypothetical protein